ncbi:uncharacterized protein (TIGR02646 family) [Winogradskyella wandonensis]|uniref:Uncharacterized protein (TIGR02646 family) n=1 Tax=Winogradskyella wandonensis TaxID=1442586 RepID=A0A4R1KQD3_9FLAO|nr:hypothetical protein [Winogradskyella wandonensis]TCK67244.1 uncharacterized protein (TIGR02646 family) [Winogradskyella wandonensis]
MRFVTKPDNHKTATLASQDTANALLDIATNMTKDDITDAIYRESYGNPDEKRSRVEDQLALSYYNKCAYCERLAKADIEHYRPKKKVVEDNTHNGYYWLCYEWTNLLPSCVKCNREGAKHSKFPILGIRVYTPSFLANAQLNLNHQRAENTPLLDEMPYLLHPEVDDPEAYFDFFNDPSGDGIRIRGIDAQNRGNETIGICLLNRQELRLERVENVINPFKQAAESAFAMLSIGIYDEDQFDQQIIFQLNQLMINAKNEKSTHTLLRKYIVKSHQNFSGIVLPYLSSPIQSIVLAAFKSI